MMKFLAVLCLTGMVTLLGGCRTLHNAGACLKPQPYMAATSVPPLKVPQGLDAPDTTSALKLPVLTEPAPPRRSGKEPCLDEPPPFKITKPAPAPQA